MIENIDIIITEGYKKENKPSLEIVRKGLANISVPEVLD